MPAGKKEKKRARAVSIMFQCAYSTALQVVRELADDAKARALDQGSDVTDATIELAGERGLLHLPRATQKVVSK